MKHHDYVIDVLREVNPAPPGTTEGDLGLLLAEIDRRHAAPSPTWHPARLLATGQPGWRRGLVVAATAMVLVVVVGIAMFLATRGTGEPEPATPTTTTTVAPTTTIPDAAPPVTVPDAAVPWPSPRYAVNAAFDVESGVLVLFGGTKKGDFGLADTWVYDPGTEAWTESRSPVTPPGRMAPAIAYEPRLDRIVMFGGLADNTRSRDDLWLYDVNTEMWEQVVVDGPKPRNRWNAGMAYVDSLGGMLLYGGNPGSILGYDTLEDMWLLDTTTMTWSEIVADGPGPRDQIGLAYDPEADLVVLTGGDQPMDSLTWHFDPATITWTAGVPAPGAGPNHLSYDPVGQRIVGTGLAYDVATATWSTLAWGEELPDNRIYGASNVLDPDRRLLYQFGADSYDDPGWVFELWEYDLTNETWRLIGPGTEAPPEADAWPSPRYALNVAFDEQSDLLVLFGGAKSDSVALDDTWVYDPAAGRWTEQDPPVHPPLRLAATMAYDRGMDRMVLFGGLADDTYLWDDLWVYDTDADSWEKVDVADPKPSARHSASMTYIDSLGGMMMFGGSDDNSLGGSALAETWILDTTTMTWTEMAGDGPPPLELAGLAYDPKTDIVVMAGGYRSPDGLTWTFDPTTLSWSPGVATPSENPPNLLAYDPDRDRMVSDGFSYSLVTSTWSPIAWDTPQRADGSWATGPIIDPQGDTMYVVGPEDMFVGGWVMEIWACDLATGEWRFVGPELD